MKKLILLSILLIVGCAESDSIINLDAPEYTDSFSCTYHINYYEPIAGVLFPINSWDWELDSLKSKIDTLDIFQGLNLNDAILNCTSNNSLLWLEESSSTSVDTTWCDCEEITGFSLWGQYYNIKTTTSLILSYNELTGSIPPEIGNLTHLTHLQLNNNELSGEIPVEIGNLTKLTGLDLGDNQLTGEIPIEIGNLTNLEFLRLRENQLSGLIPNIICDLTNLQWHFGNIPASDESYLIFNNLCEPYPSCLAELKLQSPSDCPDE